MCVRKSLSHVQLFACQAPQSMGFSRQDYWSGLPFTSPRDLPDPGIEPRSPALQADSSLPESPVLWAAVVKSKIIGKLHGGGLGHPVSTSQRTENWGPADGE